MNSFGRVAVGKGARVRRQRAAAAAAREDFEPVIRGGLSVPAAVINTRLAAQADARRLEPLIAPRIEGHLLVYERALDELIDAHCGIADTMEFGFRGQTRWAAVWELSGRCIALSRAMLSQIRAGFASEVAPTMRSVHEACQLLTVVTGPGEEVLLARWLDSQDIGVQAARSAENRISRPFIRYLSEQGITLEGNQYLLNKEVYEILSAPAHNMRDGFLESVSPGTRQFAYGPHPDWRQRAVHAEFAGQQIEEVVLRVGSGLSTRFLGADFYRDTIQPTLAEIKAVRIAMPIDPPTVRAL
jgi:hypothetical protein